MKVVETEKIRTKSLDTCKDFAVGHLRKEKEKISQKR